MALDSDIAQIYRWLLSNKDIFFTDVYKRSSYVMNFLSGKQDIYGINTNYKLTNEDKTAGDIIDSLINQPSASVTLRAVTSLYFVFLCEKSIFHKALYGPSPQGRSNIEFKVNSCLDIIYPKAKLRNSIKKAKLTGPFRRSKQ